MLNILGISAVYLMCELFSFYKINAMLINAFFLTTLILEKKHVIVYKNH